MKSEVEIRAKQQALETQRALIEHALTETRRRQAALLSTAEAADEQDGLDWDHEELTVTCHALALLDWVLGEGRFKGAT